MPQIVEEQNNKHNILFTLHILISLKQVKSNKESSSIFNGNKKEITLIIDIMSIIANVPFIVLLVISL